MKRSATIYSLLQKHAKVNNPSVEKRRMRKDVSPSEPVIRNLLSYSQALTVITTHNNGFINLVMN